MNKSIGLPILPAHRRDARDHIHLVIPGEAKPRPGTSSRIERNFLGVPALRFASAGMTGEGQRDE